VYKQAHSDLFLNVAASCADPDERKIERFSALVILIMKGSDLIYLEKNSEKMSLGSFYVKSAMYVSCVVGII
jgi:hypothetical protein